MRHIDVIIIALILLTSCSQTKNLAEDEVLYTGIRQVAYDKHMTRPELSDSAGVITAVANAYATVSAILAGESTGSLQSKHALTKEERDSLATLAKKDREAYAEAKTEVEAVLAKKPNNSFLGSAYHRFPFPLGLWVYNRHVTRNSRWSRWVMNTFGSNPVTITEVNPRVRSQVATNTLRAHGYFRGDVSYLTTPSKSGRKAKVSYEVHPGALFRLDSIEYQRFPAVMDSIIQASRNEAIIRPGQAFNASKLDSERTRISELLRNHGFYYHQASHITFRADTVQSPLNVQLQVRPSADMPEQATRQYHIGTATINILRNDARTPTDTISRRGLTIGFTPDSKGRIPLKPRAMLRHLRIRPGDMYSHAVQTHMQSDLSDMGAFALLSVDYTSRGENVDTLDLLITARLDKPYDAEFRGNIATKSNGLLGPGLSFSMSRGNAFRGAEKVSLDLNASYEWMTGAGTQGNGQAINSFEYGAALNLHFPRLTMLTLGERLSGRRATASTTYKIDANWMNRSSYFERVTFGADLTYAYQRRPRLKHELTPLRIEYSLLQRTTAKFDSIMARTPALRASLADKMVFSTQYTLSLPSLTVRTKVANQFVKLTAEATKDLRLGYSQTHLVGHVLLGAVKKYKDSFSVPYSDLLCIGGANSLRAFSVRSIGPGSYDPATSGYSYIDAMGDLKLEANLELRFPLVSSLGGALFLDAGNVWLMTADEARPGGTLSGFAREIALGTGFGFRYDLDFLVLRFDLGVGLHAPYATSRARYYNMASFGKSLGYHIAIGYPF